MERKPKPKLGGTHIVKLWKKDVADLNGLLKSYGGHKDDCSAFGRPSVRHLVSNRGHFDPEKCTCGWAEVESVVRNDRTGTKEKDAI